MRSWRLLGALILFLALVRLNHGLAETLVANEKEAIEIGKVMLQKQLKQPPTKTWLCVTFMKGDANELDIILKNACILPCDWAVVFYSHAIESKSFQTKICNGLKEISPVRHCQGSIFNATKHHMQIVERMKMPSNKHANKSDDLLYSKYISSQVSTEADSFIPKQVMYSELLPYLSDYKSVIMMDSDMLFVSKVFNFTKAEIIIERGYKFPLKLAQPCTIGPVEFSTFHQDRWTTKSHVAIGIDFIEQQSFFVNSLILEWSIRALIAKTVDHHIIYKSDWGYDSVLCLATKTFTELVLGEPVSNRRENPVCAILTRHCILHTNTKTIKKTLNFHKAGPKMFHLYRKLFPHWYFDITARLKPEAQDTVHWDTAANHPQY